MEFLKKSEIKVKKFKAVAFGSTRRKNITCGEDGNVAVLAGANVEYVAVLGKAGYARS
jgi:hypothetical protein